MKYHISQVVQSLPFTRIIIPDVSIDLTKDSGRRAIDTGKQPVDVLIVNPDNCNPMGKYSAIEPPIWAGLYASYAREKGNNVLIHDCQQTELTAELLDKYNPREVWIIVMGVNPSASSTPKMPKTIELAKLCKSVKLRMGIGGLHPLALPYETRYQTNCDFILEIPKELTKYNVAWDLLPMEIYRAHNWHCLHDLDHRDRYAALYTAYGCPFNCSYCNIHTLYEEWQPRELGDVVYEIDTLVSKYGIKNLKFCDELFTVNPQRVKRLCWYIEGFKLNIWAYARVGTVNPEMLKQMKRAGINWLGYGFESFSPEIREGVNKKFQAEDEAIKMTRDAGININANFMFGLPGDNKDTMKYTLERAMSYNFEYVNFYITIPYPGSGLWDDKLSHDWARYNQFSPNPIADKKVVEFRDKAFVEYFSNPDYLNMIEKKFGGKVKEHIEDMLKIPLVRR